MPSMPIRREWREVQGLHCKFEKVACWEAAPLLPLSKWWFVLLAGGGHQGQRLGSLDLLARALAAFAFGFARHKSPIGSHDFGHGEERSGF